MNGDRLTVERTHGLLKDLLERLASSDGHIWHAAFKRFLLEPNPEFYRLEIGSLGAIRLLLERFQQAGFSISPLSGAAEEDLRSSNPKPIYGRRECFRMLPVRAMELGDLPTIDEVSRFGHVQGCVATSWEAACWLLMEVEQKSETCHRPRRLLNLAPTPIVWTFVGGDHESRASFAIDSTQQEPMLVALVSAHSGYGFKGIVEAEYMYRCMGRHPSIILPDDTFLFSINTNR